MIVAPNSPRARAQVITAPLTSETWKGERPHSERFASRLPHPSLLLLLFSIDTGKSECSRLDEKRSSDKYLSKHHCSCRKRNFDTQMG